MGLQIGIIGAGGITRPHLLGFRQVADIDRIVVADINPATLDHQKKMFPEIEITTDYKSILRDPKIPIVDVCVPHNLHHPVVLEAFDAGKDVFCEKPIATTLKHARDMIDTAKRKNRKFYISLNQMFTPAHRQAREMIRQGKLGKLLMGVWKMIGDEFDRMNIRDHWKGDIEKAGGGAFFDTGMHAAYVLLDLVGPARQVSAFTRRLLVEPDNKGDDNSVAIVEFESGAVVTYAQTYTARSEDWNEKKYIYGSEGSLHIDDTRAADAPLTFYTNDNHKGVPVPVEKLCSLWEDTLAKSVVYHMDCYIHNKMPFYDAELAVQALQLILAFYRSDELGRAVRLEEIKT